LTAVLVLLFVTLVAGSALLLRILTRLAAVLALPGLTTLLRLVLSALAGLTALLALSRLIALLILLVHVICHKKLFLLRNNGASAPSKFNRHSYVSCRN
jgi:hypothetical protein